MAMGEVSCRHTPYILSIRQAGTLHQGAENFTPRSSQATTGLLAMLVVGPRAAQV